MSRSAEPRVVACRLCGEEFVPSALACHAACPLGPKCSLICCPNCGYQIVDESSSSTARVLKKVLRIRNGGSATPRERPEEGGVPLTHVPVGREVEVRSLRGMVPGRSHRLSAFGLVPGSRVQLLQRKPAPVLRIGETELAVSDEILDEIWVEPVR